jgi:hypothetical protein
MKSGCCSVFAFKPFVIYGDYEKEEHRGREVGALDFLGYWIL